MTRTQIQLPDALYKRAKAFAAARELSLAELTRRGLELFLERFPEHPVAEKDWKLPRISGGLKVAPSRLREIAENERDLRGLARR